ncbi:MAG: hypothetical protein ACI80V_000697 [Rhodothermales bacterium]|jgi:hypothetical protein
MARSLLNKWRTPFYGGGTPSAVLPLLAMAVPLLFRTPYIWHSGARSLAYSLFSRLLDNCLYPCRFAAEGNE